MGIGLQIKLLLWKNFKLRSRAKVQCFLEIFIPLIFFIILLAVRSRGLTSIVPECHLKAKPLATSGLLNYVQGMFCLFNNTCSETVQNSERRAALTTFNSSLIDRLIDDVDTIVSNSNLANDLDKITKDYNTLKELSRKILNNNVTVEPIRVKNLIIDPSVLWQRLRNLNVSLSNDSYNILLNSTVNISTIINNPSSVIRFVPSLMTNWSSKSNWSGSDLFAILNDMLQLRSNLSSQVGLPTNNSTLFFEAVCDGKQLQKLIIVSDPSLFEVLRSSLCNLTRAENRALVEEFARSFNRTAAQEEALRYVREKTGNSLLVQIEVLQNMRNLLNDMQRLDSLKDTLTEVNRTLFDIMLKLSENRLSSGNNSTDTFIQLAMAMSGVLCGDKDNDIAHMLTENFNDQINSAMNKLPSKRRRKRSVLDEVEQEQFHVRHRRAVNSSNSTSMYPLSVSSSMIPWIDPKRIDHDKLTQIKNDKILQRNFFRELRRYLSTGPLKFMYNFISPLLFGKILYYPDSPLTRRILQNSNVSFERMNSMYQLADSWLNDVSPQLWLALTSSSVVDSLRLILDLCKSQSIFEQSFGNGTQAMCRYWASFLKKDATSNVYSWRVALHNIDVIMLNMKLYFGCLEVNKFTPMLSEAQLESTATQLIVQTKYWAGIVFDRIDVANDSTYLDPALTNPTYIKMRIRFPTNRIDSTLKFKVLDQNINSRSRRDPLSDTKYFTYGFIYLQDMLERGVLETLTNKSFDNVGIYTQQFPNSCYTNDKFLNSLQQFLPLLMVLSWVFSVSMIVKAIVYEKERRLKEMMKVMGLSNGVHWLAWFITSCLVLLISTIILVILLRVGTILPYSNPLVILVLLISFMVATIFQSFLISVFFSRANLAAACGGIIFFCSYLPYGVVLQQADAISTLDLYGFSLLSPVAFAIGTGYIMNWEQQKTGLQWSNLFDTPNLNDPFNMGRVLAMLWIDSFIYGLIMWYVEAVWPGQYGIGRPFYFLFTRSYWLGRKSSASSEVPAVQLEMNKRVNENHEPEPTNLPCGVRIQGLVKRFNKRQKPAVNGLWLNFYESQITSFLGHNGAGKTTTMSILTGLFSPSSGTALIYDQDIRSDIEKIRQNLGLCPQFNVLFDMLTVEEHIWFYGLLKGMAMKDMDSEIDRFVHDVGLPHKRRELSKNLSGGMKRKLSVAMAFVGGSKTVILDEPTAGVDPYARRSIWDILCKFRQGRTIILTTHHMDEADILGDRIAIISQGQLKCCGSSMFLKSRFGSGYYLTFVKADSSESATDEAHRAEEYVGQYSSISTSSVNLGLDLEKDDFILLNRLHAFVRDHVPEAEFIESVGTEITFQLPDTGAKDGSFQRLFSELDTKLADLGISSYGISDSTLEEVFLKVADDFVVPEARHSKRSSFQVMMDRIFRSSEYEKQVTDSGTHPRPVNRLSFRRKKFFFSCKTGSSNSINTLINDNENVLHLENGTDNVGFDGSYVSLNAADVVENIQTHVPPDLEGCNGAGDITLSGVRLIMRQFAALMVKRWHNVRRSKKGFLAEIILPVGLVLIFLLLMRLVPPVEENPPMELHPWLHSPQRQPTTLNTFYSIDQPLDPSLKTFESLLSQNAGYGIGNRCLNSSVHAIPNYSCLNGAASATSNLWRSVAFTASNVTLAPCTCSKGYQECQGQAAEPPSKFIPTDDFLFNATGRNLSDWLLRTQQEYIRRRFGGLSLGEMDILTGTNQSQVSIVPNFTRLIDVVQRLFNSLNANSSTDNIGNNGRRFWDNVRQMLQNRTQLQVYHKIWYNNQGYASSVAYLNVLNNMLLRANLPVGADPQQFGIVTVNHPLKMSFSEYDKESTRLYATSFMLAMTVIFALSFVPASFLLFLISERVSNAKHLQMVSGVNPYIYWVANFCWDMLNYSFTAFLVFIIFVICDRKEYVGSQNVFGLLLLFLFYGFSVIPLMYPCSFFFKVPSTAFVIVASANLIIGVATNSATTIIDNITDEPDLARINEILKKVFLIFPQYCLGNGLFKMAASYIYSDVSSKFGLNVPISLATNFDIVGKNLLCMFFQSVFFFILTLLIERRFCCSQNFLQRCCGSFYSSASKNLADVEDNDVCRERQRVKEGRTESDVLVTNNLSKVYGNYRGGNLAVDSLYLGVHRAECFGLLGVNGAGKSSTFKMLTGEESVTTGDALINGKSIVHEMVQVHQQVGYCPQFDALNPLLTGRETLTLYARLRGVPEKDVSRVVRWAIFRLGLSAHADKVAQSYSGGNKRKLSTAIALIGNPTIIFLDEPTSGMDPGARRFLWNCIEQIVRDGRSVVLTSHSMEECEALCHRLAIMVNGRFKCLGSVQHLKNKFGDGYTAQLRLSSVQPHLDEVKKFVFDRFQDVCLLEEHLNMLQFQIGGQVPLAHIFEKVHQTKELFNVEDYSISQTTLDQVFINFAKQQSDMLKDELVTTTSSTDIENTNAGQRGMNFYLNRYNTLSSYVLSEDDHYCNSGTSSLASSRASSIRQLIHQPRSCKHTNEEPCQPSCDLDEDDGLNQRFCSYNAQIHVIDDVTI